MYVVLIASIVIAIGLYVGMNCLLGEKTAQKMNNTQSGCPTWTAAQPLCFL